MLNINWEKIRSIATSVLTGLGTFLVVLGIVDSDTVATLKEAIETVLFNAEGFIGGLLVTITLIVDFFKDKKDGENAKKVKEAEARG